MALASRLNVPNTLLIMPVADQGRFAEMARPRFGQRAQHALPKPEVTGTNPIPSTRPLDQLTMEASSIL